MALLSELITRIVADNTQFNRETAASERRVESFEKRMQRASRNLQRIGRTLTTFVTAPIVALGVAAVKAASDMEESINAVNVVFGKASQTITDFSRSAAREVGLSAIEINQASTVLGSALQNVGLSAEDAAKESILLTKRAADMASVFNTDVNQALTAIQALLRGEIDPIERFGVSANEAAIKARALASGIFDGTGEMTAQEKVLARLQVLYEQTERVAGDFANTSDSLANKTRIAKAEFANLRAELGAQLLPIASDLVGTLRTLLSRFAELTPASQRLIIIVAGVAAALGPLAFAIRGVAVAMAFLAANPMVALVGALAAAGLALGTYVAKQGQARTATLDLATAQHSLNQQMVDFRTLTREDVLSTITALERSIRINQDLLDELGDLNIHSSREAHRQARLAQLAIATAEADIERLRLKLTTDVRLTPVDYGLAPSDDEMAETYARVEAATVAHLDTIIGVVQNRVDREKAMRDQFEQYKAAQRAKELADEQALQAALLAQRQQLTTDALGLLEDFGNLVAQFATDDAGTRFAIQKAFGIAQTIISTAIGVAKALEGPPPLNFLHAAVVGARGAAQTALIAAQQPPSLAAGGVHSGPAIVGEGGGPELALPLTDYRALTQITNAFERALEAQARSGQHSGGGAQEFVLVLDGERVGKVLGRMTENGQLLVDRRALVR